MGAKAKAIGAAVGTLGAYGLYRKRYVLGGLGLALGLALFYAKIRRTTTINGIRTSDCKNFELLDERAQAALFAEGPDITEPPTDAADLADKIERRLHTLFTRCTEPVETVDGKPLQQFADELWATTMPPALP